MSLCFESEDKHNIPLERTISVKSENYDVICVNKLMHNHTNFAIEKVRLRRFTLLLYQPSAICNRWKAGVQTKLKSLDKSHLRQHEINK